MRLNDWRRQAEEYRDIDRAIQRELEDRMYVYIQSETGPDRLYTVGFYKPDGSWEAESDHTDAEEAAQRVHYLNGGRT